MNKLWAFGDSFTYGYGCVPGYEYYENYRKDGDKLWCEHIADNLNFKLENKGKNGCSNDYIIDEIIKYWDRIQSDDMVIIGKTYPFRFDIPNPKKIDSDWITNVTYKNHNVTFQESIDYLKPNYFTDEEYSVMVDFIYHFSHNEKYKIRQNNRLKFLSDKLKLKGVNVIIWDVVTEIEKFERIIAATNGEINDGHFSYDGHLKFSKFIMNKINDKTLI